jgi:hypothetical protein
METGIAIATYFNDKQSLSNRILEQYAPILGKLPYYAPEMPCKPGGIRELLKLASTTWVKIS